MNLMEAQKNGITGRTGMASAPCEDWKDGFSIVGDRISTGDKKEKLCRESGLLNENVQDKRLFAPCHILPRAHINR